jgi:hypothetical protein
MILSRVAKTSIQEGLASIKRRYTTKENPKQIRTPHVLPHEQNQAVNEAQETNKYQMDLEMDFNTLTCNLGQFKYAYISTHS